MMNFKAYLLWDQIEVVNAEHYSTYDEEVMKKAEELKVPGLMSVCPRDDHFVFSIETTGAIQAYDLFSNAIRVLREKLDGVRPSMDDDDDHYHMDVY